MGVSISFCGLPLWSCGLLQILPRSGKQVSARLASFASPGPRAQGLNNEQLLHVLCISITQLHRLDILRPNPSSSSLLELLHYFLVLPWTAPVSFSPVDERASSVSKSILILRSLHPHTTVTSSRPPPLKSVHSILLVIPQTCTHPANRWAWSSSAQW